MKKSLTHDLIAQRAHQLWREQGEPFGHDDEIWIEAERQLHAEQSATRPPMPIRGADDADATSESAGARGLAERVKAETAAESVVENNISPAISEQAAIKAALPGKSKPADKKKA
jgi:hypothetical protein